MKLTHVSTVRDNKCYCCGKNKKDVKLYCDELVDGSYCGKCYEKLVVVENIKKDISEIGDLMTISIGDIIDLTVEKLGYLK